MHAHRPLVLAGCWEFSRLIIKCFPKSILSRTKQFLMLKEGHREWPALPTSTPLLHTCVKHHGHQSLGTTSTGLLMALLRIHSSQGLWLYEGKCTSAGHKHMAWHQLPVQFSSVLRALQYPQHPSTMLANIDMAQRNQMAGLRKLPWWLSGRVLAWCVWDPGFSHWLGFCQLTAEQMHPSAHGLAQP